MLLINSQIKTIINEALIEDCYTQDYTTNSLVDPDLNGSAIIKAKTNGVICGIPLATEIFNYVDPTLDVLSLIEDGEIVDNNTPIISIRGKIASILISERTVLNFLQRLSGIATETNKYVSEISSIECKIIDTRKTTPGLRQLEKYAVRTGGASNHRMNLSDGILIKDNHIEALKAKGLSLKQGVIIAKSKAPHTLKVEVETETLEQVQEAIDAGADIIMLDNMDIPTIQKAVALINKKAVIEVSGGVNLTTVRKIAEQGVDLISVGAITHSFSSLDISLDIENYIN
ncbi:MAG: carboxylating nicotinate-nucleotide diphosphorylase [SAR202 cluster bacterium]|nr:nicotinate-nucleotide diphosphorylase (carboxylating) [Chloroflexota bacterium]MQG84832.1 carboxylating nicotinate-nucleotide diphosphorylase [SAR202 cluster bacterium]|tara:strand:- start:848 stop:1708 length:861 start_codon:yes stop_codon:yes gene_type:complete